MVKCLLLLVACFIAVAIPSACRPPRDRIYVVPQAATAEGEWLRSLLHVQNLARKRFPVSCRRLAERGGGRVVRVKFFVPGYMEGGIWSWVLWVLSEALFHGIRGAVAVALLVGGRVKLGKYYRWAS